MWYWLENVFWMGAVILIAIAVGGAVGALIGYAVARTGWL